MAIFFVVVPDFMKIIFIQLPDEARKVAMLEVLRKDRLGEPLVLFQMSKHNSNQAAIGPPEPPGPRSFHHRPPI